MPKLPKALRMPLSALVIEYASGTVPPNDAVPLAPTPAAPALDVAGRIANINVGVSAIDKTIAVTKCNARIMPLIVSAVDTILLSDVLVLRTLGTGTFAAIRSVVVAFEND